MTTTTTSAAPPRHPPGSISVSPEPGIGLRPLRIGMIGFGTVGRGFFDLVEQRGEQAASRFAVRPSVAAVLVLPILLIVYFLQRYLRPGALTGAVKG